MLDENRNAVFIWSVQVCFMFVVQINVIFMQPPYEAVILCECILKCFEEVLTLTFEVL